MSISNLNNQHLTEEQIRAINEALTNLETALKPLNINLTADDRHKYGRVNEQNKLFINKINDFATSQAELRSPDVVWEEFFKDYKSREVMEKILNRLNAAVQRVQNAKILHDFDNYQDALEDYAYTSYPAKSKTVGFENKYNETKQFFAKSRKKNEGKPSFEEGK